MEREFIENKKKRFDSLIEEYEKTLKSIITDSNGVKRHTIFKSDTTLVTQTTSIKNEETIIEPNPFNATLVVFEGGAITTDSNGEKKIINEKLRSVFIPKGTKFVATATEENNTVITILDQH